MKTFTLAVAVPLGLLAALSVLPTAEALPFPGWFHALLRPRATICNGFAENCSKKYSNFTVIGTHDSYAISPTNLAANQDVSITAQLNAGVRMLQSQAHQSSNKTATGAGIDLCHTSCSLFQGGSLESYLAQVKAWSDQNPTEVVSLLIVNSDSLPASQFAKAFESTGLAAKSYRPPSITGIAKSDWPTLGTLIDAGTPVVNFLASYADSSVPYLIDEFTNAWEPPYNQLKVPFDCSVDRVIRGYNPANLMYFANFFKDQSVFGSTTLVIPDKDAMSKTNSMASILQNANICASQHNSWPTVILTDFFNTPRKNGPLEAAAFMNGTPWTSNSTGVPNGSISYPGYSASSYAGINGPSSGPGNSTTSGSGSSGGGEKSAAATLLPSLRCWYWNVPLLMTSSALLAVGFMS